MANDKIVIKGAREHNLKNIDLTLPREKFIVMTGLSGSGKSSLAFDTIYADGQRRYVESLSSYARMFLGRMDKPDVDEITGLSPAISIDQKTTSHNPRSTVGTVTEIYDYLRLLYARVGVPHCPVCGRVISQQTVDEMVDAVLKLEDGTKFQVLAPVVRQRKGTQQKELDAARRGGYSRVRIDGNLYDLDEEITLEKNIKHTVEIVVDRLAMRKGIRGRLADSLETALALTGGIAEVDVIGGECMTFSQNFACPEHGISIGDLSPRLFSFNNPQGACEKCTGLGTFMRVDEERILPNKNLSIRQGAIKASGWYYAEGSVSEMYYLGLGKKYGFTLDTPIKEKVIEALCLKANDFVALSAGKREAALKTAGVLVKTLGAAVPGHMDKEQYAFCWIVDFPMYEIGDESGELEFCHNPFSMPAGGLDVLLKAERGEIDPLTITADQYDLVCNGVELSSGAVRNHDPEIMIKAFELVRLGEEDVKAKFPAMYNAFTYGAPPHAGIAPGVDRMVMLLAGEDSIREIIPFPMNKNAQDVMMSAPSEVTQKQLDELHIQITKHEE